MSIAQDIHYALRMIRKRPAASAIVMLTLGVGIGANGIFFANLYGAVLRPLPFEEPEALVSFQQVQSALGESRRTVSAAELRDWMEGTSVFAGAGAFSWRDYNFQSTDEPDRIAGCEVTAELFPLLGVRPFLGRNFLAEEDRPGGPLVALIGYDVWARRFASDPAIVGKTLRLDGEVREIVGVMPEGFRFAQHGQLWTPFQLDMAAASRADRRLEVIGRLREGGSLDEAKAAMGAVAERLAALHPETNEGWTVEVLPLRQAWLPMGTAMAKLAMVVQMGLISCVLLIVCANVTNVVLAQATVRRQERALRAALGASRGRLIRQTLVESTVLALGGGVLGALLAAWSDVWLKSAFNNVDIPYWYDVSLERHGVIYLLVVTLVTGVLIGLLPAIRSSGRDLFVSLKSASGHENAGGSWLRQGLVVVEYAIALVILVAGLLMVKSFNNTQRVDRGFETDHVLTLRLSLTDEAYGESHARAAYLEEALRRLGGLAESAGVGVTSALPVSQDPGFGPTALGAAGLSFPKDEEPRVIPQSVSAGFFEALSIPRLAGRSFSASEVSEGADVALVSQSLAEFLWPGEDPLHRRVRTLGGEPGPWLEVVGVVGDIEPAEMLPGFGATTFGTTIRHRIYLPLAGTASPSVFAATPRTPILVLASHGAPSALMTLVRGQLQEIDRGVPLFEVQTMDQVLETFYFIQYAWSRVFSAIAFLALVIAAIGVYGVTTYSVSQRVREMSIRIVMGASPQRLLTVVVRQGMVLAAIGVGVGLVLALPLARAMETLLHDMKGLDPGVFASVVVGLLTVGLVASYLPARRAASADPIVVLRDE